MEKLKFLRGCRRRRLRRRRSPLSGRSAHDDDDEMLVFEHFRSESRRHFPQKRVGKVAGGEGVKDARPAGGAAFVGDGRLDDAGGVFLLQVGHEVAQGSLGVDGGVVDEDDVGVGQGEEHGVPGRRVDFGRHVVQFVLVQTETLRDFEDARSLRHRCRRRRVDERVESRPDETFVAHQQLEADEESRAFQDEGALADGGQVLGQSLQRRYVRRNRGDFGAGTAVEGTFAASRGGCGAAVVYGWRGGVILASLALVSGAVSPGVVFRGISSFCAIVRATAAGRRRSAATPLLTRRIADAAVAAGRSVSRISFAAAITDAAAADSAAAIVHAASAAVR